MLYSYRKVLLGQFQNVEIVCLGLFRWDTRGLISGGGVWKLGWDFFCLYYFVRGYNYLQSWSMESACLNLNCIQKYFFLMQVDYICKFQICYGYNIIGAKYFTKEAEFYCAKCFMSYLLKETVLLIMRPRIPCIWDFR